MRAATDLRPGERCACARRAFEIVAAGSYPANGATVVDLAGGAGQAVLAAAEPLDDMAELLRDTRPHAWFADAGLVRTRRENFAFDLAQADVDGAVVTEGGARFDASYRPSIDFDAFGGGPGRSGLENAAALDRAMNALKDRGGRIVFGGGSYRFAPNVYPATNATVWLVGLGYRATQFVPSFRGGSEREWMMVFGADDSVSFLGFCGIDVIGPPDPERTKFNGIRVCPTNQLIVENCHARFVDGTAWQFERAHNSKIDVRTFKCGSSADGLHAVLMSGTTGDFAGQQDAVFNDAVIVGMTEQDYLGWKLENGLVIRPESSIKVHGGPEATRSLHLHRISNGAMSVYPTLGFDSDAFIVVSDAASAESQTIPVQATPEPTRFNLHVVANHNIRNFGDGTAALIAVDCAAPGSRVILSGDVLTQARGEGDIRYVRLIGPGNVRAEVDLSGLQFQDPDSSRWVEDRRTRSSRLLSRRAAGVFLPAVVGLAGYGSGGPLVGQADYVVAGGDPKVGAPRMSLIGLTDAEGPNGTLLYCAMQPITATIAGDVDGAATLVASQRLNVPVHGEASANAVLRRLTVGASGVAETHDASNCWTLRVYVGAAATDLLLCRERTSASAEDGLPSEVLQGWSSDAHGFDFHRDVGWLTVSGSETFSLRLEPIGSPPALRDVTATAYFEMRR